MRIRTSWRAALAGACAFVAMTGAADAGMNVKEIGSFYVGGKEVILEGLPSYEAVYTKGGPVEKVDPNGQFEVGQMYVQYVRLESPSARYPLMLWHGGGLSGSTYETKPDGQPGWQNFFLQAGNDVYISDAVERGRATWARYPEINPSTPLFRTKAQAWTNFRIGKTYDPKNRAQSDVYPGTQFPVAAFDAFMKGATPRWTTSDAWTQAAYNEYLARFPGGVVILAHSQAGNFAINAALAQPDKVKGLILIEPSGAPDPGSVKLDRLKGIPHLIVWGDYMDRPELASWAKSAYFKTVANYHKALNDLGASSTWIDLPKEGIRGNTHMMFLDRNSDEVGALVDRWMKKQGLHRTP